MIINMVCFFFSGEYVLKSGSGSTAPSEQCDNELSLPLEDLDTLPLSLPDLLFEDSIPITVFDEERSKVSPNH